MPANILSEPRVDNEVKVIDSFGFRNKERKYSEQVKIYSRKGSNGKT